MGVAGFEIGDGRGELRPEDFGVVAGQRRVPWWEHELLFPMIGYEPYRQQWEFHRDPSRIRVVAGAKRIGKSFMGAREVYRLIGTPGTHGWFVGCTYKRAQKEFEYLWNDLVRPRHWKTLSAHNNPRGGHMYVKFAWDSVAEVRSAKDPNDLEAEALDWVVVCEPAQHKEETFELLRERVSEKRGIMILPGTPPPDRHWLKKIFDRGQDPGWGDYASWQIPATETPYPGADEVEKLERELSPLRYRRDILAQFVATDKQVYPTFGYSSHVEDLEYDPDMPLYWTFDFGFDHPWVCLWVQIDRGAGRVYVIDEYYAQYTSNEKNIAAVKKYHKAAGYHRTVRNVGDPRSPSPRETLRENGVRLSGKAGSRKGDEDRGIEKIRELLELSPDDGRPRLIVGRKCDRLIDEFTLHSNGSDGKPMDADNDGLDALRYQVLDQFGRARPGVA